MFIVNSRAIIERQQGTRTEIVIQTRNKANERLCFELPGGRLEPYESFVDALIREVKEETGLDVVEIEGMDTRITTEGMDNSFIVECIRPFSVYQTVKGPIDSVGAYFRCRAEGQLLDIGDNTKEIRWINVSDLKILVEADPLQFSNVDRAGIIYYLNDLKLDPHL